MFDIVLNCFFEEMQPFLAQFDVARHVCNLDGGKKSDINHTEDRRMGEKREGYGENNGF